MALLSRKVDYALLILSYLHEHPEGGCAREIASRFELSRAFLANILKELCQKGFVASHRGVKGGYILQFDPHDVVLGELMEQLDDTFRLAECNQHAPSGGGCGIVNICPLKGPIAAVHQRIREVLRGVKLSELFRSPLVAEYQQLGILTTAYDTREASMVADG